MLQQVLGIHPDELTYDFLLGMKERREPPESQSLDYKEEPEDNVEFSKSVAAMANSGGGVVILGVKDENSRPVDITPVDLVPDGHGHSLQSHLQQVFASRIHPFINLAFHEVRQDPSDSVGVLVIEILPGDTAPFAVEDRGRLSYYVRSGEHKFPLTEAQVAQMYRDRFSRQSETAERFIELRNRASRQFEGLPVARIYVAGVPVYRARRIFRPTGYNVSGAASLYGVMKWYEREAPNPTSPLTGKVDPVFKLAPFATILSPNARPSFRCIQMAVGDFTANNMNSMGWLELHDDGSFLGTVPCRITYYDDGKESRVEAHWWDHELVGAFLARLAAYWALGINHNIRGEISLRAGIIGASPLLPISINPGAEILSVPDRCTCVDEADTSLQADISNLEVGPSLVAVAKSLLDDLFTSCCWPECLILRSDGSISGKHTGQVYRGNHAEIWAWAESVGIEISER